MNTIPASELKRRGINAVDDILKNGDVHVIKNNKPQYVVISEERYAELTTAAEEAQLTRVKAALEDVAKGKTRRFSSAASLIKEFGLED